jgi:DUF2911 family protein
MKKTGLLLIALVAAASSFAQTQASLTTTTPSATPIKIPALDKSPLDMSYFPVDFPMIKTQSRTVQSPLMRVIYSRPQRDGRTIFGDLVEYNTVWRLGANEATEIEFFRDATIAGKKLPKGRYTLYAIPTENKWTIIFNKDTDTWGAFVYDSKKDVLRTEVPVQALPNAVEAFSMGFTKTEKGATLVIAWEKVSVSLPIEIK